MEQLEQEEWKYTFSSFGWNAVLSPPLEKKGTRKRGQIYFPYSNSDSAPSFRVEK